MAIMPLDSGSGTSISPKNVDRMKYPPGKTGNDLSYAGRVVSPTNLPPAPPRNPSIIPMVSSGYQTGAAVAPTQRPQGWGWSPTFNDTASRWGWNREPVTPNLPAGVSATKGVERPGFVWQPVYDDNGQIIGWREVKLSTAAQMSDEYAKTNSVDIADADLRAQREMTAYDEIHMLEITYAERARKAREQVWGTPTFIGRGNTTYATAEEAAKAASADNPIYEDYSKNVTNPWYQSYLGVNPGYIKEVRPEPPGPNASYEEVLAYRDKLKTQFRPPQYTAQSLDQVFNGMTPKDIKSLQRTFKAAHLYSSTAVIIPGVIQQDQEVEIMKGLMSVANYNGLEWTEMLNVFAEDAKAHPERYNSQTSGGGGGGGATTSTQIVYNQTSMSQARQVLNSVLQDMLGRNPTSTELSQFVAMLNQAESRNPTKTVQQTNGTTTTQRTTPSPVDVNALAEQFASQIDPKQYKEYQSSYYLNLLLGGR